LKTYQLSSGIGQVPESPEAVLNESLTGVAEVDGQGLHAARIDDCRLVARANRQNCKKDI
jgi:hypothetical protein